MMHIQYRQFRMAALFCVGLSAIALGGNAEANNLRTVSEPTERAFSMGLPQNWQHQLLLHRQHGQQTRISVRSNSPDGVTQWFFSDPSIPQFTIPGTFGPELEQYAQAAGMTLLPPMGAAQFADDYVRRAYGNMPGFRVTDTRANPELVKYIKAKMGAGSASLNVSSHIVTFEVSGTQGQRRGELWASTFVPTQGRGIWIADTSGYITGVNTAAGRQMFVKALYSQEFDPQWQARENQRVQQQHQQIMAQNQQRSQQSTAAHQQRMASQQASFQAHQNRMAQSSAASDARHQSWMNNQNTQYQSHQNYVRSINETTLINGGGNSYEADAGYNNYYVDPLNQQYIGTDVPLDSGAIPDGYQEATEEDGYR
jgi:hypothetical protein